MRSGLHCNTTRNIDALLDYYDRSGATVCKVLTFDDRVLDALRRRGVTIIGRVYESDQRLGAAGGRFIRRVVDRARRHPLVDYWEGYNEAFQRRDQLRAYAEHEVERMRALEDIGALAVIGCFSTGQPEPEDWEIFFEALDHARRNGHALGVHEYSGPYMQYMVETPGGGNQWRGGFTGVEAAGIWDRHVQGWLTLRYRKAYDLFRDWGIGDLPLFVTEGGIDDVNPRPGGQGKGYKDFAGTEWSTIEGIGDYADQRRWYMWQVSHDRYVRGVVDFGWDTEDQTWRTFDLLTDSAMRDRVIAAEADLPVGHFGGIDEPVPVPPDAPLVERLRAELGERLIDDRARLLGRGSAYPEADSRGFRWIAIHHTATAVNVKVDTIDRYHRGRGWAGIGYHFVIRLGAVHYVGDVDTERAHIWGRNDEAIGIAITGNYETRLVDDRDAGALMLLITALDAHYGERKPLVGHRAIAFEGHETVCPGRHLAPLVEAIADARPTGEEEPPVDPGVEELRRALVRASANERVLYLNPGAALLLAMLRESYLPVSNEFSIEHRGTIYVAQLGDKPNEPTRVYFAALGEWANVRSVDV